MAEKRKWSSVRSYLCGDEFNSVLAEEDSASVKSSEATVTQPILEDFADKGEIQSEDTREKQNSVSKLFHKEDAAIIIQTAFRGFLVKNSYWLIYIYFILIMKEYIVPSKFCNCDSLE